MDIIKKITFMLWFLAIVLIAPPVLRYFQLSPQQALLKALFLDKPNVSGEASREQLDPALLDKLFSDNPEVLPHQKEELLPDAHPIKPAPIPPAATPPASQPAAPADTTHLKDLIGGLERIGGLLSSNYVAEVPYQAKREADAAQKIRWSPPPAGFTSGDTFNYLIYREMNPVTLSIKSVLDTIHGNLMLDLTPFTLISKPGKILVMLFGDKKSYINFTQRPAWSGASSDLKADSMYVLEGNNFYPLSVHELTHLYFDGYFLPAISPLWLSEGMAVYMQINTTKEKPSWIDQSLRRVLAGQFIPIDDLVSAQDINSYSTPQAQQWYTQAYSLVDYLLNKRTRDEFYTFSNELKSGSPVYQALYRAYGMPFTKMSVLENVWLHDLHKEYENNQQMLESFASQAGANLLSAPIAQPINAASPAPSVPAPEEAPVLSTEPLVQKTVIKKLQIIPTNGYQGAF